MTTEAGAKDPASLDAGFLFLRESGDSVMAALVERIGPLDHAARRRGRPDDAFGSLVRTIVGQQLSTQAARTIYARLVALFGDRPPAPVELLIAEDETLRGVGLSRQKIAYLRDLAARVHDGKLELPAMNAGGEVAEVRYLLPREPDPPQDIILGGEELYGLRQTVP
ncbi:MAG TPA: hypothetical protein VFH32_04880, partial [Rubrobacteraceae bacterium]|nr:hypothetical protein [Rubrobacteraceae bacterium]